MSDSREKRRLSAKYKKLLNQLRYIYSDLEYHKEEHGYRKQDFQEAFNAFCKERGYDCSQRSSIEKFQEKQVDVYKAEVTDKEKEKIKEETDAEIQEEESPDDPEREIKALYRKIAVQTHPDKISDAEALSIKEKKKRLFIEAKEAMDSRNFFRLSQIAEELGVELPPPSKQQLVWLREEKKRIEKIIAGICSTYEWAAMAEEGIGRPKEQLFEEYATILGCARNVSARI